MKNWKKPSKVGFFSIVEEIFINAVAVQTPPKAKSRTTRSLLMQDWVFRLGVVNLWGKRFKLHN